MEHAQRACKVRSLDHLVLTVADIGRTTAFYSDVLGMQAIEFKVADGSSRWALKFGSSKINLHEQGNEFDPKAHAPTPGSADVCFLSDAPCGHWQEHLTRLAIPVEEGPVRRTGATEPLLSLYIRDPDGNLIEISHPV